MTAREDPADAGYVARVLDTYRATPGTCGHVRPADRRLARDLFTRGIPLQSVLDALSLATARRYGQARPNSLPPTVRSLAYFGPVVDEVVATPFTDDYRRYLASVIPRILARLDITR